MDTPPSLRLLIVEDDVVDRKLLERLLAESSLGACQVQKADRLAAALELLRQWPCDLVLLDLGLPDSQGMESVVRLQASAPQTPIIVLSGLDDVDVATQAVQRGVQDYLIKGQVDASLLMRAIRYALERKRMHEILDRKQRNLEAIFDAAPLGMLLVNQQMRVMRANDTIHQMSGKEYAHLIDHGPCEALGCLRATEKGSHRGNDAGEDPNPSPTGRVCDGCRLWQTIQMALASGVPVWGVEVRPKLNEDGDLVQRWLSVSVEPVNVDGVKHVVVALNDVTDRKRAEEELRETMEMKSQFISTVSHELRTPMTAMREAVIIVLDEIAGTLNEDQKHFLDIAKRNIDRLSRLIDDVLDLQKLSAGKMKFHMQANDIAAVVQEAYATMQPHAAKSRVDLAVEVQPHLPAALYDGDRIMQALTNLISNAIKFTPEGGRVLVSVHRRKGPPNAQGGVGDPEDQLVIKVSDTGYGIPKEDLPKLFSQFFRVHRPGKEIKGTGLGLAIVSKIVAGHGGRIEVESELDQGTTFTVFLPLTPPRTENETSDEIDRRLENMLTGP